MPRGMAVTQSGKSLSHKHEDLSSNSHNTSKKAKYRREFQHWGGRDRGIPSTYYPASLDELMGSRFN